ncbi:MAG: competence/damage-inducible protein A [Terriglobales bacterium]
MSRPPNGAKRGAGTGARPAPTAEILAVGSELLGFARLDTNSLFLTRELLGLGFEVTRKAVVPDRLEILSDAIASAWHRVGIVICTGGLGPTEDDRTVAAAAQALGCPLMDDPAAARRLRRWSLLHGWRFTLMQLRQARRLAPAQWLPNRLGSAYGQWWASPGHVLVLLPGPPSELQAMFLNSVRPRLAALTTKRAHAFRVLSIAGLGESQVDAVAAPLYRRCANLQTTILATAAPQVELHFHAVAPTMAVAQARADALARKVERRLGVAVFSRDQRTLAEVVGDLLHQRCQTLATAESCTGGMLAERITLVPGASQYFLGGVISYDNAVKQSVLGVRESTLRRYGAVSTAVARQMAEGVRVHLGSDWGVAITGVAGPSGGSARKPVGTVYIAVARPGAAARAWCFRFYGDRDRIRRCSAQAALNLLRLRLLGHPA